MNAAAHRNHLPDAGAIRRFIEAVDRRLLTLFDGGDEPDDATIRTIADLEIARAAGLRVLADAEAQERALD